jgi:putative spermidine/putrescine transport system permease protein
MLALYAYPFVSSVYRSFLDKEGVLTLANYVKAWERYQKDVFFSLGVSVLSTVIAALLSIALAAYLRLATGWFARLIGAVYRFPIFIPFVVVAQMMRTFLAPHGLFNIFLAQMGLLDLDAPLQFFNWKGLTFGFVWKQAPFMTLLILSGPQPRGQVAASRGQDPGAHESGHHLGGLDPGLHFHRGDVHPPLHVDRGRTDHCNGGHRPSGELFR